MRISFIGVMLKIGCRSVCSTTSRDSMVAGFNSRQDITPTSFTTCQVSYDFPATVGKDVENGGDVRVLRLSR